MNVLLLDPAPHELQEAIDFYNDQMQGLGNQFYYSFLDSVSLIERNPSVWRKVGPLSRRVNIGRFPYFILYVFKEPDIYITCIAHQHRKPEYYVERMHQVRTKN